VTEVAGTYYDGRSSRPHAVAVLCTGAMLHTTGEGVDRTDPLDAVMPSAPLAGVPFTLRFADGARLQVPGDAPVAQWFPRHHRLENRVNRWERRAGIVAAAVLVVALALVALFNWGVPMAADYGAMHLPQSVDRAIGKRTLGVLRAHWLAPSTLPEARRGELKKRFRDFVARTGDADRLQLEFYRSKTLGANALSLGGGIIVVTDAMVRALPDDDAFLAVTAHEMGHQRYRHMLRTVLRSSGVAVVAGVLAGDVSGSAFATAIPVFLLNAHYSRGFEAQADDFAFHALARAGISPMAFVRAMLALEKAHPELRNDASARYLSSHPVTAGRIARAKAAAQRFERAKAAGKRAGSLARDGHLPDQDRAGEDRAARIHVGPDGLHAHEHVAQVAGDRHFLHRMGDLAVLDPESRHPARIVAGHDRDTLPQ
jgi:Zn-dependent protease with chaperone function